MPEYTLTKLEAARRQIESAIRLYFHGGDPIAIHTLSAAGRNVLANLCAHRGVSSPVLLDSMLSAFVKPEHHREVREAFRAPENFFKHADRDPDGVITFNPDASEFFLLEGLEAYGILTGEVPASFAAFRMWWLIHHPQVLNDPPESFTRNLAKIQYGEHQRAEFYSDAITAISRSG